MSVDEKCFDHAVQLAAAFVASGDVRLHKGLGLRDGLDMLPDLIDDLYDVVAAARERCLDPGMPVPPLDEDEDAGPSARNG
mgnify:CR=1 FL=1